MHGATMPKALAMSKMVPIEGGAVALVDDQDYELVSGYTWKLHDQGYAYSSVRGRTIYMHRLILDAPPDREVDHKSRQDRLDNRRSNIRLSTRSQNMMNRPRPNGVKSPYRGVRFHKQSGRWDARIKLDKREISLGYYPAPDDAARAYNLAAKILHGEFAQLNDADGPPPRQSFGVSGYRGVYPYNNSGTFKAVHLNVSLGIFANPEDAARAYDEAVISKSGHFARLNFPLDALKGII